MIEQVQSFIRERYGSLKRAYGRIMGLSDLLLFGALIACGLWVVVCKPWGFQADSASALAGALFGGAALLLGNWINRINEQNKADRELERRVENIKSLIAAELVDVACGLLGSKKLVDAAIISINAGGYVAPSDMSEYRPRAMSLTESLGAELLILDEPAIDTLATLRSNLAVTRESMDSITRNAHFGLLAASRLSSELAHDMSLLSEAFGHIAPDRKLPLAGKEPEFATDILARAANPPTDPRRAVDIP